MTSNFLVNITRNKSAGFGVVSESYSYELTTGTTESMSTDTGERPYNWSMLLVTPIVLFGITGNILVCMAVSMEKRLQSVTNYFLFSLAVTDLLVCIIVMPVSIINDVIGYWPFDVTMCNLYVTSDVFMSTTSILHLCSISMERYLAIRSPLRSRNKSKAVVILKLTLLWLLSATISSPVTILGFMDKRNILNNDHCSLTNETFIIYGSIFAFFIPLLIMIVTYSLTIRLLYKQAKLCDPRCSESDQPIIRRSKSRRHGQHSRPSSENASPARKAGRAFEMGSRSTCDLNSESCDDSYIHINIRGRYSSESVYTACSTNNSPPTHSPTQNGLLAVPGTTRLHAVSIDSLLLSDDNSTDEDNNHISRKHLSLPNQNQNAEKLSKSISQHIIYKASSILNLSRERNRDKTAVRTEQKASKVLGIVFVIFVFSWAPFFVVNILSALCKTCSFNPVLISIFVWLGWVSSTLNPIIYTMFNSTFKMTFIKLLRCQYGFLQKSFKKRHWNANNGFANTSSDSNAEIPL